MIQLFSGGAILMMIANPMMPGACEYGGKLAGTFTVIGFFISVAEILFEYTRSSILTTYVEGYIR